MRKFTLVFVALVLVVAVLRLFFLPEVLGIAVNLTCHEPISVGCQARMRALGHLYSARKDMNRAADWYAWAGRSGDREAMFHAGWAKSQLLVAELQRRLDKAVAGDGTLYVPSFDGPDDKAALDWYTRSAEAGFAPAMNNLGEMYRFGVLGRNPEPHTAFYWHSKAAELGNPLAQLNLAADYYAGFGTALSSELAHYWASLPREARDNADLTTPTLGRTRVYGDGDRRFIESLKRTGELPDNWDLEKVVAKVRAQ